MCFDLFPDTARIDNGSLSIDGIAAADLVREHGSPLVVYDETTLRARARAYREAAPTPQSSTGRRRSRTSR